MGTKRKRPFVGMTISQEVHDWLIAEAKRYDMPLSRYCNTILRDAMARELEIKATAAMPAEIQPCRPCAHSNANRRARSASTKGAA